jgi:DNA repair exonuclease SbcCD ATPase subunit
LRWALGQGILYGKADDSFVRNEVIHSTQSQEDMMKSNRWAVILVCLLAAFLLAACGGKEEGEKAAAPVTKEEVKEVAKEAKEATKEAAEVAKEATEQAAEEAKEATEEAAEEVKETAEEAADTAAAEADELKAAYLEEVASKLDSYEEMLNQMESKASMLTGEAKENLEKQIIPLREKFEASVVKMEEFGAASGSDWEALKPGMEESMTDLGKAFE